LHDQKGEARATLTVYANVPKLVMGDENGKVIWSAP
jgi:hypothetical protein